MSVLRNLSVTSGVFMAIFVLSIVSAQNELELSSQSDLEPMDEIQELLRNVQVIYDMKVASKVQEGAVDEELDDENDVQVDPNGCSCSGLSCSCCRYIRISVIGLQDNCCVSLAFHPRNLAILFSLKFGSRTLFSKLISARNPKPVCIGIPKFRRSASVCIQFYSLSIGRRSFSGCIRFLARLFYVTVANFDLGCFHMSFLNATQQVEAVELPYLDGQQAPVEGSEPIYLGEVPMEKIKSSGYKKN